ncbi:AT-rich interactive domain-containing protein 3B-like [Thalassophryne amazonica]|uniref:AT-rich interactive domain-containing protein 3B-like n=1 Tax=Thalassophryne amazonica TaxID=390379 RepID=UPI00147226F0|nr:AT-rich interactive domain-containing protein 3B-like [Thalassophryne amazonica]
MMELPMAQTSSLAGESCSGGGGCLQTAAGGVNVEALMAQLQRQQYSKSEFDLPEKRLLQTQLLFPPHPAAAALVSKSGVDLALVGRRDGLTYQPAQPVVNKQLSKKDPVKLEASKGDMMEEEEQQVKKPRVQQTPAFPPYSTSQPVAEQLCTSPASAVKEEPNEELLSPAGQHAFTTQGFPDWGYDESAKQRVNILYAEEGDGGKARGEPSRDFSKLYELDNDPQRKEFLDELFVFMQKRGTPVSRIPIMAKQVLDLYRLFKLVTEKGGLVEVINRKIWREITKGLNLPTSITSAAFTLRTQYVKYLYAFECEKKGLSSPGELQVAIESNRREGRRPSYTNSLYHLSSSPSSAPHVVLTSPKMQTTTPGHNGLNPSVSPNLKRNADDTSTVMVVPSRLPVSLGRQRLAPAPALELLRERLERCAAPSAANDPEKKLALMTEEQQRLMQHTLQQNLLTMASHFNPANLKLSNSAENKEDLSLRISTNGASSISVSVEVNGTIYSGRLFAQKSASPVMSQTLTPTRTSAFTALSSSHSPSSSSKGPS